MDCVKKITDLILSRLNFLHVQDVSVRVLRGMVLPTTRTSYLRKNLDDYPQKKKRKKKQRRNQLLVYIFIHEAENFSPRSVKILITTRDSELELATPTFFMTDFVQDDCHLTSNDDPSGLMTKLYRGTHI